MRLNLRANLGAVRHDVAISGSTTAALQHRLLAVVGVRPRVGVRLLLPFLGFPGSDQSLFALIAVRNGHLGQDVAVGPRASDHARDFTEVVLRLGAVTRVDNRCNELLV